MSIKKCAFEAHTTLRSTHGIDIKRTHVHEVLAALLGFASHAAMSSQRLIIPFVGPTSARPLDIGRAVARVQSFGYPPSTHATIAGIAGQALDTHGLFAVELADVLDELGLEDADDDGYEDIEVDEFDAHGQNFDANILPIDLYSSVLREELERVATTGNAAAHLALATLAQDELEMGEAVTGGDGSYWFKRQEAGHTLSGVELEWANMYRRQRGRKPRHIEHLMQATALGSAEAALRLAEIDGSDESFETAARVAGEDHASRLGEIAWRRGKREAAQTWLRVAATQGDTWAMKELASELEPDLQKAWTWVHLANLLGHDVMAYHAVGEDGMEADADEAGPLYAAGGFELDHLPTEADSDAMREAQAIYEGLTRTST